MKTSEREKESVNCHLIALLNIVLSLERNSVFPQQAFLEIVFLCFGDHLSCIFESRFLKTP